MLFFQIKWRLVKLALCLAVLCFFYNPGYAAALPAAIEIKVGSSARPPFLAEEGLSGAAPEVIAAMNSVQNQFEFVLVPVPIKRRTQSLADGWVDVVMWDNPAWGWQEEDLTLTMALVSSKDIFLALKKKNRNQQFFAELTDKNLVAVHGYHYKFANYVTELSELIKRFNITLVRSEEVTINMILAHRAEVAVVSTIALNWFLQRHPEFKDKFIVSKRFDTAYDRFFLVPKSSPVQAGELNRILAKADQRGLLADIYRRYGLKKPDFSGLYLQPVR
ncbi:substrate-binding periplasmic protein [Thalassomonas haliotis]|uniref:Transporter substrate-binding domain-containing protein n=1 Tax=Thalassomonas haliotis TaxID=485448 RepID=A0ABY7VGU9_9GAMM|nr:transporter substrate-binding domain-containing protein [Thalassomonas haliotis]WDE12929.1 transporter substrate-binding domain-containing protein [Thalassomonas haliotis]